MIMLRGKRFLLVIFWTSYSHDFDPEHKKYLLFSSRHLLAKRVSFSIIFSDWSFPHLHPFLHRWSTVILFWYWLLLLAVDVAVNSGPVKYPCSQCTQPVRIDQQGILCDRCDLWTHAKCCGVSNGDYLAIGEDQCEWLCPVSITRATIC